MRGASARAGIDAEDGEDAGERDESLAEHAAGGRDGGGGGGKGGANAVGEPEPAEFVVPVDGFDRVFEGTVSISGGRMRERGVRVMGRMWSISWCTIRSIDRRSL